MIMTIHRARTYPHPDDEHLELVLAETNETYTPYVVWTRNHHTDSLGQGDYYKTLAEAQDGFDLRYSRLYHPTP